MSDLNKALEMIKTRKVKEIAHGTGLHTNTIYKMKKGGKVDSETVSRVLDFFEGKKQ